MLLLCGQANSSPLHRQLWTSYYYLHIAHAHPLLLSPTHTIRCLFCPPHLHSEVLDSSGTCVDQILFLYCHGSLCVPPRARYNSFLSTFFYPVQASTMSVQSAPLPSSSCHTQTSKEHPHSLSLELCPSQRNKKLSERPPSARGESCWCVLSTHCASVRQLTPQTTGRSTLLFSPLHCKGFFQERTVRFLAHLPRKKLVSKHNDARSEPSVLSHIRDRIRMFKNRPKSQTSNEMKGSSDTGIQPIPVHFGPSATGNSLEKLTPECRLASAQMPSHKRWSLPPAFLKLCRDTTVTNFQDLPSISISLIPHEMIS